MQEEFLSTKDVAARWKISTQSLNRWRLLLCGPPYVQLGKAVRYKISDILEFERNGLRKPISRPQPTLGEQQPDQPTRLLMIRDVVADLHSGPLGNDGR